MVVTSHVVYLCCIRAKQLTVKVVHMVVSIRRILLTKCQRVTHWDENMPVQCDHTGN